MSCTEVIGCWLVKGHKKLFVSVLTPKATFFLSNSAAKFFLKTTDDILKKETEKHFRKKNQQL